MRFTMTLAVGVVSLALLTGCDQIVCTELAAVSVTVHVLDEANGLVPDATVTFAVDGGAEQPCDSFGIGPDGYSCGYEVAGEIVVKATAPGRLADTETVIIEMDADECHVVGQTVTLTLVDE